MPSSSRKQAPTVEVAIIIMMKMAMVIPIPMRTVHWLRFLYIRIFTVPRTRNRAGDDDAGNFSFTLTSTGQSVASCWRVYLLAGAGSYHRGGRCTRRELGTRLDHPSAWRGCGF